MNTEQKTGTLKVLIVDDEQVIYHGLEKLFEGTEIRCAGWASSGEQLSKLIAQQKPDLVLLDVRLGNNDNGLRALASLKMDSPELPVLVFSGYDNPLYAARAAALGASGYLLKGSSRDELLEAIQAAIKGESLWTRTQLRKVTGALSTPRAPFDVEVSLTLRETEVLEKLCEGMTNKEIGPVLGISYETVKEHVQNILRKIGVNDRTQAAVWAARRGLCGPTETAS